MAVRNVDYSREVPQTTIHFPQLDEMLKSVNEASHQIGAASRDMQRYRPSKFPLISQLIAEISDISSMADLKAQNESLLVQLGAYVSIAVECGWDGGDTNGADAISRWIEHAKLYRDTYEIQIAGLEQTVAAATDLVEKLKTELLMWQKFASYCRCCAQSGENTPDNFEAFKLRYEGMTAVPGTD
jgi:hypothetical protein